MNMELGYVLAVEKLMGLEVNERVRKLRILMAELQRFTSHVIDAKTMGVKSALPVDLDGDGDTDLVAASFFDDTIAWYDNDGSMSFRKKVIDSAADGAYFTGTRRKMKILKLRAFRDSVVK